ncbi:PAS domain S-box-containing protein [Ancylobacter sp. 3268]|uniref:PAS domain S-box protein n=1 Tax=Ancylobacter sp. 3268 TaxID=2817752 RepID=UPI0028603E7A|nr:PAS domain S-box protein [Ancylobacter sp. 3268]MDR6954961.1 PAS domain S-box-containing protein [Ancylobacter sp. 3268]
MTRPYTSRAISADEWRQIVDSAVGTAIITTDLEGRVTSWNEGASRMLGWTAPDVLGETLERLFPPGEGASALRQEMRDALTVGRGGGTEGWRIRRDGSQVWAVGEMSPIRDQAGTVIGFTKILHDRTREREAQEAISEERRALEILNRAGSALAAKTDLQELVQIVTDAGVELTGAEFGAFFYNVENQAGESYMLYTLSGVPAEAFAKFPMPRNTSVFAPTFSGEGIVRSDDITRDPRYGQNAPRKGMPEGHLPVRSYLAVPVISRTGEVIGGLFFGHADIGVFDDRSERGLEGLAAEAAVAIDNARLFQALERELAQRRKAESELAASEARLRLATEAAEIGTWDYDPASNELRWDVRCRQLFGLSAEATVTYEGSFIAGIHPDDRERADEAVRRAIDPAGLGRYDIEYRTIGIEDGKQRWISASGRAFFNTRQGTRFVGTVIDVTERKATEERLHQLNDRLEEQVEAEIAKRAEAEEALRQAHKMEAVGQLTGGIAHDFNNLLAGITGSLEIIERRLSQGRSDGIERFISAAQTSAQRAAALTQRLLAFSRRQTLDPKPTDVNRLVFGMEDLITRTVGPAIKVEVVGAAGLWPTRVDTAQLESALLNLAINARDAMPDGGKLTIETANKWLDTRAGRERDLPPGQYISVCVTDTGTGIPKDIADRIFDPFFTTKPIGQGTGLGLSMIHGFVRQSGGQVRVYSEPGHGTTMCLYLPRYFGDIAEDAEAVESAIPEMGAGETVLVIDDEPTVRMLIVEVLEEAGYVALEAEDGPSGLKILQSDVRVDLLITDVGLPGGMNGRQVADAARLRRPHLKVLFVTGFAENAAVGNGHLEAGMEVITKPFMMTELANKITDMIENRHLGA